MDMRMQPPTVGAETNSFIVPSPRQNCKRFHEKTSGERKKRCVENYDGKLCSITIIVNYITLANMAFDTV